MKFFLPDGRQASFRLGHVDRDEQKQPHRTFVVVTLPTAEGSAILTAEAICSKRDHFSKKIGRRIVANRILSQMKELGYSKEARRAVFQAICPGYK